VNLAERNAVPKITVEIDDELIAEAESITGLTDNSALIRGAARPHSAR